MTEKFLVEAGRIDYVKRTRDEETGEPGAVLVYCHAVSFSTAYGIVYTHLHQFPDTLEGLADAQRLAARVQRALDAKGLAALSDDLWNTRIIYGSVAYQEEEPFIVQREKEDDRMGL